MSRIARYPTQSQRNLAPPQLVITSVCKVKVWLQTRTTSEGRSHLYRPQTNLWKGNIFTTVCHSVRRVGMHLPRQTPPMQTLGRYPLGRHPLLGWHSLGRQSPRQTPPGKHTPGIPPWADIHPPPLDRHPLQTATAADDTHPTGMHSCWWPVNSNRNGCFCLFALKYWCGHSNYTWCNWIRLTLLYSQAMEMPKTSLLCPHEHSSPRETFSQDLSDFCKSNVSTVV